MCGDNVACGIDFGTSNSTVATVAHGRSTLIPIEDGKTTLPSAVFFPHYAQPLFGRVATRAYLDGEEGRLMRGLKKILGTSLMDEKTIVGRKSVSFTDILKVFTGHLKSRADDFMNTSIEHAVLGRPVHFHDDDDAADRKSQDVLEATAKAIGFKNVEFLFEPIAAAFAHENLVENEKLSLVIDLGGGTSDFTVIRISKSYMKKPDRRDDILGTSGVRIGGTTFDYRLSMKSFMPALGLGSKYRDIFDPQKLLPVPSSVYAQLSDWAMIHHAETRRAVADTLNIKKRSVELEKIERLLQLQQNHLGHALLAKVEESKIALTSSACYEAAFSKLSSECSFPTTSKDFNAAISDDLEKVFQSISDCLTKARTNAENIELVVLTGGSTELPIIEKTVKKLFPHADISQKNKLDSVGLGLAYRAATIFGDQLSAPRLTGR